jgi:Ca2+-binding EF-hand superfamily protein
MMNRQRRSELKPLWKSPGTNQLATAAAAYYKSNLYIFADHAMITNIGGQWTAQAKDGYHATLYCLSRDQAEPVAIPMAFDLAHGPPPLQSLGEKLGEVQWEARPTWMHFSEDTLYLGESDVPAVWAVPLANVQAALAAVKAGAAAQKAALAIVPKKFLEKYDLNHNGLLDPEEKEAALEDPAFIEAQLDLIDTNHNERLDLGELFYFDANQDKILEPREAVGLQIAQKLLAQKALLAFDQNGDGVLNPGEFRSFNEAGGGALNYFPEWDKNRDGKIDAAELEACMNGALLRQLMFHNHLMLPGHGRSFDQPPSLKDEIEAYWRNPADPPWWSPKRNGHVTNRGPSGIAH